MSKFDIAKNLKHPAHRFVKENATLIGSHGVAFTILNDTIGQKGKYPEAPLMLALLESAEAYTLAIVATYNELRGTNFAYQDFGEVYDLILEEMQGHVEDEKIPQA